MHEYRQVSFGNTEPEADFVAGALFYKQRAQKVSVPLG